MALTFNSLIGQLFILQNKTKNKQAKIRAEPRKVFVPRNRLKKAKAKSYFSYNAGARREDYEKRINHLI